MTAAHRVAPPTPLRVLVVEDEPLIRWALSETLTRAGHTVLEAGDAAAAIDTLSSAAPIDVALMDLRLPDSHDLSLLARIRRQWPTIAVIMMTAYGTRELIDEARAMGVYDVMDKPFDVDRMEHLVADAYAEHGH